MTCSVETFLRDVVNHQMEILRDDGVHRHIVFKRPGSRCYQFDLITWPGHLCYTGDMGTYVFCRIEDMFEFFRTDRRPATSERPLSINPSYWGEKLLSISKNEGYTEFGEDRFRKAVLGDLIEWIRYHRHKTSKEERRELWEAVMSDVMDASSDSGGYRKQAAAHDFFHQVNPRLFFEFQDFFEHRLDDYTFHFMWCCYALAWGIKTYDEAKAPITETQP